jgi:5-methylcytosine-specific restriction endonuclease McrA
MKPRKPLKRSTKPIRRSKPRADVTVGNLGRIRLKGKPLEQLRLDRWTFDRGLCLKCGHPTYFEPRYDGDPEAYDMAHIKSRGAGGSDVLSNVETWCHRCHMRFHNTGK